MLGDLFYRVGATLGALDAQLRGKAGAGASSGPREVAVYDTESGDVFDLDDDNGFENVALASAAAWLVARLLRPKPVSWPRVVVAGIGATLLADIVGRSVEEDHEVGEDPFAESPEELMARFGAGIAMAAAYAALLYPRIPGSPLFRGLVFGGLEVAATPRGGLVGLATDTPGVKFPLQALALPVDEDAGPLSHLAYGVGLGLLYRYDGDDD